MYKKKIIKARKGAKDVEDNNQSSKFKDWMSSDKGKALYAGVTTLGNIGSALSSGDHKLNDTAATIKSAGHEVLGMLPMPYNMIAQAADSFTTGVSDMLGKTLDGVTKADVAISSIPILGPLASLGSRELKGSKLDTTQIAEDFGTKRFDEANKLAGANILFGYNAKKNKYDNDKAIFTAEKQVTDLNKKRKNNNIAQDLAVKNISKLSGNDPTYNLKTGGQFPELDDARRLIQSFLSSKIKKHQNGGVIEEGLNIIPSGALHKNKHHIEETNPELEGKITKKGIPVVSMDDGGEVQQQIAEVEENELTLSKSSSYTLESFYERYKNASEEEKNEIEVETGKWIADQILHNTQDNTGLIKEVKI